MKKCKTCEVLKPLDQFNKVRSPTGERSGRGGMGVSANCKLCISEKRRPGLSAERAETLARKEAGKKKCSVCLRVLELSAFSNRKASPDGKSYKCRECYADYAKDWRARNPDAHREYYALNKDARTESYQKWAEKNKERRTEYMAWWAKANKDLVNEKVAYRNAHKKQATVPWANRDKMKAIYDECARISEETGVPHEVDHIYPLQGETVSGLHWEGNLNIITKFENIQKLNKMPSDDYLERCGA